MLLFVGLIVVLSRGADQGMAAAKATTPATSSTQELTDLNFRYRPPQGRWQLVDNIKAINRDAVLGLGSSSGMLSASSLPFAVHTPDYSNAPQTTQYVPVAVLDAYVRTWEQTCYMPHDPDL